MASWLDNIVNTTKTFFTDKDEIGGAAANRAVQTGKDINEIAGRVGKVFVGAGDKASGAAGWVGDKAGNVASNTKSLVTGSLNNPVVGRVIAVAALIGIYKWAKGKLTNNRKQNDIEIKNQQAARIEAQNEQMVNDYREMHNPNAKQGHVDKYMAEKGAGRSHARTH
jgi:hypothetical protein